MRTVLSWIRVVLLDAAIFALFYFWKFKNIDGAGNAFLGIAWFVAIVSIIVGLANDKADFKTQRLAGAKQYNLITDCALAITMAWFGMFWLAGFWMVGALCLATAWDREPRT